MSEAGTRTLDELLEAVDAPEDLVAQAREEAWELGDAWAQVRRPDHRIWLAACAGAPVERLIEGAAAAVFVSLDRYVDPPAALADAVTRAVEGGPTEALLEAARACEELAEGGGGYRTARPLGFEALARAAALVAHAAEGLATGEARREAGRLEQARRTGALIGAGAQVALPALDGPARLDVLAAASDPAQGAFLFATAAAAEATRECLDALGADEDAEVGALLDAATREALEAEL